MDATALDHDGRPEPSGVRMPAEQGLNAAEAARRLEAVGPNLLPRARPRSLVQVVVGAMREPMFVLLLAAGGLYLLLGDVGEGAFLTAGALTAVGLVVVQEARSERALNALLDLAEPLARVIRDGAEQRLPARELVPGDMVVIAEGDRLPADLDLLQGDLLRVDESTLTGESAPVEKRPLAGEGPETDSSLFAGTLCVAGNAIGCVRETGDRTQLGLIGLSLARIEDAPTPLQRATGRLVRMLGVAALGFCAVITFAYHAAGTGWIDAALAGLTVAVALIPEEAPMVLAVFLAMGAWRLARHRVLVRRAAVIETLGGANVLCVDKTGTLTENRMQVARLWQGGETFEVGQGPAPEAGWRLLNAAALASAARAVDPMDRAILALAERTPGTVERTRDDLVRTWPLCSDRLAVVQLWRNPTNDCRLAAKGAPEAIFRLCRMTPDQVAPLHAVLDELASRGLRVLAAAEAQATNVVERPEDVEFAFLGLVGFFDPMRSDVPAALAEARRAGIAVCMITGDHPMTALEIARRAGLDTSGGVLTGSELAGLDPTQLRERVRTVTVFARVRPEQKLALVEAFKASGQVVAMTGDGVNDAPALESAHIGIAMGSRGSDVAREAADLVLLDDSFASIIGGVRLGRRIFANLRKALTFVTAIHIPIAGLALAPVAFGLPPFLFPMHIVLLELVIDPVCALVFEGEPSDEKVMDRPPRRAEEPLFGRRQLALAVVQGLVALAAVLGFYVWALSAASEAAARGGALVALVAANLALALANSSGHGERLFARHRLAFWMITAATAAAIASVLFIPAFAAVFRVSHPGAPMMLLALLVGVCAGGWSGLARIVRAMHFGVLRAA